GVLRVKESRTKSQMGCGRAIPVTGCLNGFQAGLYQRNRASIRANPGQQVDWCSQGAEPVRSLNHGQVPMLRVRLTWNQNQLIEFSAALRLTDHQGDAFPQLRS